MTGKGKRALYKGEWMPIASAPTNGNPILVSHSTYKWVHEAFWGQRMGDSDDGEHDEYNTEWGWLRDDDSGLEPTHWMPLPKAPQ